MGTADLEKLKEISRKYDQPIPTELKLIYDVEKGKLATTYRYEPICSGKTGIDSGQIFMDWINEVK